MGCNFYGYGWSFSLFHEFSVWSDEHVIEIAVEVFQDHFTALFAGYRFVEFVMLTCVAEEFENKIYLRVPACTS